MKKLKLRGKLLAIVAPIAALAILVTVYYSYKSEMIFQNGRDLYYNQLYQANSTLINADRDYYQAYTAMLQYLSYSDYVDADTKQAYIDDYEENVQQTRDRVDEVMNIASQYDDLGSYSLDGNTLSSNYENFKSSIDAMYASYDVKTGKGDIEAFDQYFNEARDSISNMEDLIEAYATESGESLSTSVLTTVVTTGTITLVVLIIVLIITFKIIKYISKNTAGVTKNISYIAEKDLSHPVETVAGDDEIAQLSTAANSLREQFLQMMIKLKGSSDELSQSSEQMADNTSESAINMANIDRAANELAETATNTAQEVVEIAHEISEIDSITKESLENTAALSGACENVKSITNTGMNTVSELSKVTEQNMSAFEDIFEAIAGIDESTKTIGSASDMITDIASQTNLLSLNASIEAARAGEAGKGFAVVADEIRLLAEQSASSATTINQMIEELQNSAKRATEMSDLVKGYVEKQRQSVVDTRSGFENIVTNLDSMDEGVKRLRDVNESLENKVETMTSFVEALSAASQENAATAQELSSTTSMITNSFSELEETGKTVNVSAQELSKMVEDYRIE